jgi:hypothetical protein
MLSDMAADQQHHKPICARIASLAPPSMHPATTGKDSAPVAFAGFAALLAPAAPPPFVGLGADRRTALVATATCDPDPDSTLRITLPVTCRT